MTSEALTKRQTELALALKAVSDAVPEKRRDDLAREMALIDRVARRDLGAVYLLSVVWPRCQVHYPASEGIGKAINDLLRDYEYTWPPA